LTYNGITARAAKSLPAKQLKRRQIFKHPSRNNNDMFTVTVLKLGPKLEWNNASAMKYCGGDFLDAHLDLLL